MVEMTDAHCHVSCNDPTVREFLVGRDFFGVHPWEGLEGLGSLEGLEKWLRGELDEHSAAGVGEIGLDRLKEREISPSMRAVFELQLELAFELGRPVVLHGAKCWGQVVGAVRRMKAEGGRREIPFLFHGFSRSDGLIPDIIALNGYISVGPSILNDHAVNYRELVKKIPLEHLLIETDRTVDSEPVSIWDVLAKTAEILNVSKVGLEQVTDANAEHFFSRHLI